MTQRRTGFTLIELLVVIAIIAILAAILFPYSPGRGESTAIILSEQCEADRHRFPGIYPGLRREFPLIFGREPPAVGSHTVSGGAARSRLHQTPRFSSAPAKNDTICSYIYNVYLNGRKDAEVQKPAETVTIADSTGNGWWGIDGNTMVTYGHANCRISDAQRGANLGYCDGHAKWDKRENWKPSQWNPTWTP